MQRVTNRFAATSAALIVGGLVLTGCGAGQISQTSDQQSAVNGSAATVKNIALRNVHLEALQTSDYLKAGRTIDLMFVAANSSPDVNDKLVGITSDVGSVSLSGNTAVPAGAALIVGAPAGQPTAAPTSSAQPANPVATAVVTLMKPITNGPNYDFTFEFEKAGKKTVSVPISAGAGPREESVPAGHG